MKRYKIISQIDDKGTIEFCIMKKHFGLFWFHYQGFYSEQQALKQLDLLNKYSS